jgi:hypothetical protein
MNTPKPLMRNGTMTAARWFSQPSFTMMRNSGMRPSCTGIIMLPRISSSMTFLPRKRSLAKAKPANEEKKTTDTVTQPETMTELSRPLPRLASSLAKTALRLAPRRPPGRNGGGILKISSLLSVAPTIMK